MSTVLIPSVLRPQAGNQKRVEAGGETVGAVLEQLMAAHPALRDQLMVEGKLHRFVNVYLNGQDVRYLQDLATPVGPTDTVTILPAMAGGVGACVQRAQAAHRTIVGGTP